MEKITSKDGTQISYERSGQGTPLVLVHGASSDHVTTWPFVLPVLEERFTVCAVDRRGRGASDDSANYSIEREFEDIAAVVDSIGGPVDLLGHSYGALCALEAARLTDHIRGLILYEGDISTPNTQIIPSEVVERMEDLLTEDDRDGAITVLLKLAGLTSEEIAFLKTQPSWERQMANAHTVPRELRANRDYVFDPSRFEELATPTLLLVGGDSPDYEKADAETLARTLPDAWISVLDGQGHAAMLTAPELFTREVLRFLEELQARSS